MASRACEWSAAASTQRIRRAARRSQQTQAKSLYRTLSAPSRHKQATGASLAHAGMWCLPSAAGAVRAATSCAKNVHGVGALPPLGRCRARRSLRSEELDKVLAEAPPFTNLPETLMQTPASFLASVSDATNTAVVGAVAAPPPAVEA
jgi:hypothetical protein